MAQRTQSTMKQEHKRSLTLDQRARKRVAIGLDPQRPTAQPVPHRPPDQAVGRGWRWWPVLVLMAAIVATLLLIAARVLNSPTEWQPVRANLLELFSGQWSGITLDSRGYRLAASDNFDQPSDLLVAQRQADQWWMSPVPTEGVYRLNVWPNHVAWSTLGVSTPGAFRLESVLAIAPETPDGYAGLLARYQDADNFYWFTVDGQGRFQAQLRKAAKTYPLQAWQARGFIHRAGQNNTLTLEDDGTGMHVFINNVVVFTVQNPPLPPGAVGIVAGASERSIAEINVDWIKLYALEE